LQSRVKKVARAGLKGFKTKKVSRVKKVARAGLKGFKTKKVSL